MADDACDLCAEFPASYLWEWVGTLPGLPGWPIRLCARCCAEWRGWTAEDADPLPYRVRSCAEARGQPAKDAAAGPALQARGAVGL